MECQWPDSFSSWKYIEIENIFVVISNIWDSFYTEIWESKCLCSSKECKFLLFFLSTSTYLWNNDRFLVEYIQTYHASASINVCVHVHWKAHTAQKVVLKTTWQGWLDEMMSFSAYLIQLTWWINDVWIRCHWRSVTFKIVLNIKIEVIKRVDGEMTHTVPFDWTEPPNIKTILTQWILIQIFFT